MIASREMLWRAIAVALVATATAAAAIRTPLSAAVERAARTVTPGDLSAHVGVLAADDMDGRGLETSGNRRAAAYVADAFRRGGIPAASPDRPDQGGSAPYFQDFALFDASLDRATMLQVRDDQGRELLRHPVGDDFYPARISPGRTVTAQATFDENNVAGHILITSVAPGDRPGSNLTTDISQTVTEWALKGAVGIIVVLPSLEPLADVWQTGKPDDGDPSYQSAEISPVPVAYITIALADQLRPIVGRGQLTLQFGIDRRPVKTRNVVAALPGEDPARRGELVVVGAHLDHDGIDPRRGIFNGADDDASGVAGVLEVAEAFAAAAAAGARPARTIVFGVWNAEEKGLLGSRYFVAHPLPSGRPIANLNLDMIGRDEDVPDPSSPRFSGFAATKAKDNLNVLHLLGYSYSADLTSAVRDANERTRLDVRTMYDGGSHNLLRRSDHWSFLERGIPALFLTTGLHPDYHTPDDDANKINFEKLTRVARMTFEAAWRVADAPAPPRFIAH
jgi:Peptidase family M28